MNYVFDTDISSLYSNRNKQNIPKEVIKEESYNQPVLTTNSNSTSSVNSSNSTEVKTISITKIISIIIIILFAFMIIKTYLNTVEIKYMIAASNITQLRRFI